MERLTDDLFQRMVLANQYRILEIIDSQHADRWKRGQKVLYGGGPVEELPDFSRFTDPSHPGVPDQDERFVADILDLYGAMQSALASGIVDEQYVGDRAFPGFSERTEPKEFDLMARLTAPGGSADGVKIAPDPDAAVPMRAAYERMLSSWSDVGRMPMTEPLIGQFVEIERRP